MAPAPGTGLALCEPNWFPTLRRMLELVFRPDPGAALPLHRQLERTLRDWIAAGRIVAGERLPASRELARHLGLARNTVTRAYQTLVDDGLLTAHVGQGTFVAARPRPVPRGRAAAEAPGFAWEGLFAARGRPLRLPAPVGPRDPRRLRFDFAGGRVAPEALPVATLRRVYARTVADHLPRLANHLDPLGWGPLRQEIAQALVARGIAADASDVAVVSGAQQALDLVARVLVEPGDTVAMEEPGYFGARLAFAAAGASPVPVGVDSDGLRVDELARVLRVRRARLVYVTPSAQVPTGAILSEERRAALLELADRTQTPVIEDDYDSELRFEGPPLPALKTLDPAGRVVYVGTFSKALWPALRVGYVVAAAPLRARLAAARFATDMATDGVAQAVVAELLHTGVLERHVRRVRRLQIERRTALLDALDACMPADVRWTRPAGGNLVWLTLPGDVDAALLAVRAAEAGLAYVPGETFAIGEEGHRSLALAFAQQPPERLRGGAALLADLLEGARAARLAG